MSTVSLPKDAKAGPTKPEARAVLIHKLGLSDDDHLVEVGSCTGAVTVEAARRAGAVTAVERDEGRVSVTRENLAANEYTADVEVRHGEAPDVLPEDADALFVGGSRRYEEVLDFAAERDVDRVVMNVSRLEVAADAVRAFRERGIFDEVVQVQVSHGYELAGATSFSSENPVYTIVGGSGGQP